MKTTQKLQSSGLNIVFHLIYTKCESDNYFIKKKHPPKIYLEKD